MEGGTSITSTTTKCLPRFSSLLNKKHNCDCAEGVWFPVLDHFIIALFCNPQLQEFYMEHLVAQFMLKIQKKKKS